MAETIRSARFCANCKQNTAHVKTQESMQDRQMIAYACIMLTFCSCGLLLPLAIWAYYEKTREKRSPWFCENCKAISY